MKAGEKARISNEMRNSTSALGAVARGDSERQHVMHPEMERLKGSEIHNLNHPLLRDHGPQRDCRRWVEEEGRSPDRVGTGATFSPDRATYSRAF